MEKMYLCVIKTNEGNMFRVLKATSWDDADGKAIRLYYDAIIVSVSMITAEKAQDLINDLRKNLPELV